MHIGLIVPSFGSDERWRIPALTSLAAAITPHARLTVFPLRNPGGPERATVAGAAVIHRGGPSLRMRELLPRMLATIREAHRRTPFDLLHAYWLIEPGMVAIAAGRLLGVPVVTSIGGAELAALPSIGYGGMLPARGRLTHRTIMARSTLVTGGSSYVLDLARCQVPAADGRLRLAPLPVALPEGDQVKRVRRGGPLLLQVGAYLPVKGQDIAVRALSHLRESHPNAQLMMIGENPRGYRERIAALARDLGLAGGVELRERIPHRELAGWYAAADLLLMPSRHESQGMVVLEAACHGLPALGSAVGVVRDLAPDAASAVRPGDAAALADTALELLDDSARRKSLGAAARTRVEGCYGVAAAGETWLRVYGDALELGAWR